MGWLPEIGEVVLGKYRVTRILGEGGMGVVFAAENIATGDGVAVKMMKPSTSESSEREARMTREARVVAKLRSRFVARMIHFSCLKDGSPVLVMELLEGRDLAAELRKHTALPVEDALSYVIQACAGIGEAHGLGIIHRDLKPANLFLEKGGGICVLDFGLSKDETTSKDHLTNENDALGTLGFMSPEQIRDTRKVDARTDVWALGVIAYRLLMGRLPLKEKSYAIAARLLDREPLPRIEGFAPELADVIACALEKDVANRFADARAFGRALMPFVQNPSPATQLAFTELGPGSDGPLPSTKTAKKRRKRRPIVLSKETRLVLMGTVALALGTVYIVATSSPRRPVAPAVTYVPPEPTPPLPSSSSFRAVPRRRQ